MHNLSNITSESLKSVRRTILFIESKVVSTEMSKPLRTRLNKYLSGLKQDEIRIAEYLERTGGKMVSVYGKGETYKDNENNTQIVQT